MKFLVDAQLPRRAAAWLAAAGHDAVHTLDLPRGNRTPDEVVIATADHDERVVVTKDADFVDAHTLHGRPAKLLLISAGNLTNPQLHALLVPALPVLVRELGDNRFVEISRSGIVVRD